MNILISIQSSRCLICFLYSTEGMQVRVATHKKWGDFSGLTQVSFTPEMYPESVYENIF